MSTTTTRLLSSGEFCKLRYYTKPVKSAPANAYFYTNNSKTPNFELWNSCRKWAIRNYNVRSEHGTDCLQKMDYLLHIIKDRQTALVGNLLYYNTVYPATFLPTLGEIHCLVEGSNVFLRSFGTHLKVQQSKRIQYEPDPVIQEAAYSDPLPYFRDSTF